MKKIFNHIALFFFYCACTVVQLYGQGTTVVPSENTSNEPDVSVRYYDNTEVNEEEPAIVVGKNDDYFNKRNYNRDRLATLRNKKDFQYEEEDIANSFKREWEASKANSVEEERKDNLKEKSGGFDRKLKTKDKQTNEDSNNANREINVPLLNINWLIIILLGVGLVLSVLYFTGFRPGTLFRKNRDVDNENSNFNEEHIDYIAFETEIEKAIRLKNFRLAIRLLYLELLKKLNDNKQINWQPNKTNWDYVSEIQPITLKNNFQKITTSFDYAWYGNFNIDESTFALVQDQIKDFKQKILS